MGGRHFTEAPRKTPWPAEQGCSHNPDPACLSSEKPTTCAVLLGVQPFRLMQTCRESQQDLACMHISEIAAEGS